MKDTIYREDAINCLCNGKCLDEMRWCDDGYCPPVTRIKQLPSTQPERKRGHWIGGDGSYICSECNGNPIDFINTMGASFDAYVETPMNYCPFCGADMRGE